MLKLYNSFLELYKTENSTNQIGKKLYNCIKLYNSFLELYNGPFGLKCLSMSQKKVGLVWNKNENRQKFCSDHLLRREFGFVGNCFLSLGKIFRKFNKPNQ